MADINTKTAHPSDSVMTHTQENICEVVREIARCIGRDSDSTFKIAWYHMLTIIGKKLVEKFKDNLPNGMGLGRWSNDELLFTTTMGLWHLHLKDSRKDHSFGLGVAYVSGSLHSFVWVFVDYKTHTMWTQDPVPGWPTGMCPISTRGILDIAFLVASYTMQLERCIEERNNEERNNHLKWIASKSR